jgi:hypothetical protein
MTTGLPSFHYERESPGRAHSRQTALPPVLYFVRAQGRNFAVFVGEKTVSRPKSQARASTKERGTVRLGEGLERKLLSYAVAAGAAGVGVLACSSPAEAEIVYTATWIQVYPGSPTIVNLDLNGDTIADFQFSNTLSFGSNSRSGKLKVLPLNQGNAIWGVGSYASALGSGVVVGSKGQFQQGHEFMAKARLACDNSDSYCKYFSQGPWRESTRGFLGLQFTIQGEIHYAWARLNVAATDQGVFAAVTGYAYETVPNTPIITGQTKGAAKRKKASGVSQASPTSLNPAKPEPTSLGLLARGSLGLYAWRRRDTTFR